MTGCGRVVPLMGLRYSGGKAFDPRLLALKTTASGCGLDVRGVDAIFVYVAGHSATILDALEDVRLCARVTLTAVGWVRLTDAAN